MSIKALCLCVLLTALASCELRGSYSGFDNVPEEGWAYGDTISFTADSCVRAPMMIALRHNNSYPYRNLWIEISDSTRRDTVNIELCDVYGRWHGTGVGNSYQTAAPMPFAPKPGHRLCLRHVMRADTVRGIEQIGIIPADTKLP